MSEQALEQPTRGGRGGPAPAQPDDIKMAHTTYFLHCEEEMEARIARHYVHLKYPKTEARVLSSLSMPYVNDHTTVIILTRPDRTPSRKLVSVESGKKIMQDRPLGELAKEVRESEPIDCARFVIKAKDKYTHDKLNANLLMDAIGSAAHPCTLKYSELRDVDGRPEQHVRLMAG